MCKSTEQRICIKFCFKIGKPATETYQLLQQAYGEDAMGRTQVFGSVDLKRVEPPLKATLARDDRQHRTIVNDKFDPSYMEPFEMSP